MAVCHAAAATSADSVWRYVDPRIGSVGVGRTFPGPSMPYGMVKPGPDCTVLPNAGWAPMPEVVTGFSQTHVSGTGGGQKYGNVLLTPFLDEPRPGLRTCETILLGYYSTTFADGIATEITTDARCALYKFHFPRAEGAGLLVDASHFLGKDSVPDLRERQQLVGAEVEPRGDRELQGYTRIRGGWNNGDAYTVYFCLQADRPFTVSQTQADAARLTFADTLVEVRVGISYVSTMQARRNITPSSVGFHDQLRLLREAWQERLCRIAIGGTESQRRMFYTALYHTMLMPVDKTGENPKWTDFTTSADGTLSPQPYYDDYYALWDTYRTSMPLLTLIDQPRLAAMVQSLIGIYRREGYLPDARSGDCNGRTQGGSTADIVLADAFVKGVPGIDWTTALEAMLKDAFADPGADHEKHGRGGLDDYMRLGYVPYGTPRAGNRTVEYAYCDFCIAQVARAMGRTKIADELERRSHNWRNLWRSDYDWDGMRGFIMPRDADGRWLDSVPWGRSAVVSPKIVYTPVTKVAPWYVPWWDTFFYEATSEEYSLSIPHDVEQLIELCGGPGEFRRRLDLFFERGYYNVQNEPSFLTPSLYHWIGRPDLTALRVGRIVADNYTDRPDGLPGNDDSGAMSSWLALHMMGLYPNAGQDYYLLHTPLLSDGWTLTLPNGNMLKATVRRRRRGPSRITLNGNELPGARISHSQLCEGGELTFEVSREEAYAMKSVWSKGAAPQQKAPALPTEAAAAEGDTLLAADIHFTLNRQFRTWPLVMAWQGDTLLVSCKQTLYRLSRRQAQQSDRLCWLSPQHDGTVHEGFEGTPFFISWAARDRLVGSGVCVYDGITWRLMSATPTTATAIADDDLTEITVSLSHPLPLILRMKGNPLGIDWSITP